MMDLTNSIKNRLGLVYVIHETESIITLTSEGHIC